ncbi:MAG TPA: hypothetical protein VM553_10805 [Dongiaceae bacterium]|nr:hypothetical protein [Dongiaceae bacterium]
MNIETTAKENPSQTQKPTSDQNTQARKNPISQAPVSGSLAGPAKTSSSQEPSQKVSGTQKSGQKPPSLQDLSGELNNLKSDIEEMLKGAASYSSEELIQIKDKLFERFAGAQESLKEVSSQVSDQVTEQARKGAAATERYVHEQPWQAVGVGALAGLLVGFALSRRS